MSETNKFWNIVDFQKTESKKLRDCLDGNSRSNMILQVALMKRYEMIYQDDIKQFSAELQDICKKAIAKANEKYPKEALTVDDTNVQDVAAHYDYLLEHQKIINKLSH